MSQLLCIIPSAPHSPVLSQYFGNILKNVKNLQTYGTVIVYVEDTENLLEVLFRTSVGHDIQDNHEFPEVDMTVLRAKDHHTQHLNEMIQFILLFTKFLLPLTYVEYLII